MPDISAWPHYPTKRGTIPSGEDPLNPTGWQDNLDTIQTAVNSKAHLGYSSVAVQNEAGTAVTNSPIDAATRHDTLTVRAGDGIDLAVTDGKLVITSNAAGGVSAQAGTVNVQSTDYGAKCDGTTDDTAAIEAAILAVTGSGGVLNTIWFPSGRGYKTTATITFPIDVSVIMDAPIIYTGGANVPAIVVGETAEDTEAKYLKLQARRSPISDWGSEDSIGIQIYNAINSYIEIPEVYGFTIGVQCAGSADGFSYNTLQLGSLMSNKVALDLNSSVSGWVNENLFLGGRFGAWSSDNANKARYGVRIRSSDGTYTTNNNNVFLKPSFEMNKAAAGAQEAIAVLVQHGQNNRFLWMRSEGNSDPPIRVENSSTENIFSSGYGTISVTDNSTYPVSVVENPRDLYANTRTQLVWESGPMHKRAIYYDGATEVNVAGVAIARTSSTITYNAWAGITIADNYLEFDNVGPCVFVDTSVAKTFVVRRDVDTNYGGRVRIRCYDSSGNILTEAGGGHPYVKTDSQQGVSWSSAFGGTYVTGSDGEDDFAFTVGSAVKKMLVIISDGTANLRIRSFAVETLDGHHPTAWVASGSAHDKIVPPYNVGTAAPTSGTWTLGRLIYSDTPTSGGYLGWVCTTAGTPGTWKGFGEIEGTASATDHRTGPTYPVFQSGLLYKTACYSNGSTRVHVPYLMGISYAGATGYDAAVTLNAAYLEMNAASDGLCFWLDTQLAKTFVLRRSLVSGFAGRICAKCYDSSGTLLTDAGAGHPYIDEADNNQPVSMYYNSGAYGGTYMQSGDSNADYAFTVGADVAKVLIIFSSGTTTQRLRSFTLESCDGYGPATWIDYSLMMPGANQGSTVPSAGTWEKGRIVWHVNPASSVDMGWICITAGTPGTWRSLGNIQTTT